MFNSLIDVSKIMHDIKARVMRANPVQKDQSSDHNMPIPMDMNTDRQLAEYNAEIDRISDYIDNTRDELNMAADIGISVPTYSQFPWPIRSIFRTISRVIKRSIKYVIVNQVNFNLKLGNHLKALREQQGVLNDKTNVIARNAAVVKSETLARLDGIEKGVSQVRNELQNNAVSANKEITSVREEVGKVREEIGGVREEISKVREEISKVREEIESVGGKIAAVREEITEKNNEQQMAIRELSDAFSEKMARMETQISDLQRKNDALNRQHESDRADMGAMARQIMLAKWKMIDHLRKETEKDTDILTCDICGYSSPRSEFKTMESECIFNGGPLVRYVCPGCGVVFGPSKFIDQGQAGIDEDYWVHYLGFSEGDSSYKEEKAFRQLDPEKNKVYLNYGCGKWSKTLQKLRAEGYNVYGYEPYAPDDDNPYMITSKEVLKKMRFDGIFSNDVLEHFIDPVAELKFMTTLLINENSRMSHCTACYTYKYEYTRFHTHFFLGDSVKILAAKANLRIVSHIDDMDDHDFLCYVYAPITVDPSVMHLAIPVRGATCMEDGISMERRGLICGPYLTLPAGRYTVRIVVDCQTEHEEGIANYRLTCNKGQTLIDSGELYEGTNELTFESESDIVDFECVIEAERKMKILNEELRSNR